MKNAFLKDSFRQVRVTANRFIAILSVTALGVAFFAGLKATAPDMRLTAQRYFKSLNMMDIGVKSTAGFTGDDVQAIRQVKGVRTVMPAYSADALVDLSEKSLTVKLISLDLSQLASARSSVINQPKLTAGRLPENDGEILADPRYLLLSGYKVGDKVTFKSGSGDSLDDTLRQTEYTIVGVAQDPLYISYERGTSTLGNGKVDAYFLLPSADFKLSAYTDVYLTIENKGGLSSFTQAFDDLLAPVAKKLETLAATRTAIRYSDLKTQGRQKIDNAKAQLAAGQQALSDAGTKLADAQAQITANEAKLVDAQAQYDAGEAAYQQNLQVYHAGLAQYNAGMAQLEAAKGGMSDTDIQNAIAALKAQQAQLPAGATQNYTDLEKQIQQLQALLANEATLAATGQTLQQSKAQLDAAAATLAASKKQLDDGGSQLADAKAQLTAGQQAYAQQKAAAQPQLDQAARQIADGEAALASLKKPVWYVLDHNTNAGFVGFKDDADRIAAIADVFPLIFFLVAALVSLTTMTRLVEDDRTYIGTMKALGYGRGAIAAKYLLYALSASLLGSVLGLLIGFNLFPRVVFDAYGILYTLPKIDAAFNIPYAILSTAAAVVCATMPALLVCVSSLHSHPAELMRPKVPKAGKRILLERIRPLWRRFNFSQKVTARNLFRYKKRLIMTIVGVAGCTGLVFTGFGLRDSISTIVGKQYEEIRIYDMEVDLKDNASAAAMAALDDYLSGNAKSSIQIRQQSVDVLNAGKVKSVYLVTPASKDALSGYINLRERVGGKKLTLGDSTVIISEKLASLYSLKTGDSLKIRNSDGAESTVRIGGIAENYLFHYVFMSPAMYEKLYGGKPAANQLLCRLNEKTASFEDGVSKRLMKMDAVSSVMVTTNLKDNFQKMIRALRYVVLVLILSAAALAFVVLFSLTSINIDERNRELATIKVLGFYNGELAAYIYRENIVLTVLSSLIGLGLGIFMQRFVILTSEVDLVMFSRDILWPTYFYSAGLTIVFAAMVNAIMYGRFRKIDMVSSLKSIE